MLTWTRAFEKVGDYLPWATWLMGGHRLGAHRFGRRGGAR